MRLCLNQDGSFNFSHSAGFLHSRYAPKKEARRIALEISRQIEREISKARHSPKESSLRIVIIGVGWGYLIDELLAANFQFTGKKERPLEFLFYEPIPEVYQSLKSQGRLKTLESSSLELSKDLPALEQKLRKKGKSQVLFYINPSYRRLFPQLLDQVSAFFKQRKDLEKIDKNTAERFLRQWTRNAFRLIRTQSSLDFIAGYPKESVASTSFDTKNLVIYCGAAPGLLEDLSCLGPELLSNAFLIASDTALGPLLASQYCVDLAICVDSGAASLHHLHAASLFSPSFSKQKPKLSLLNFPVLSWSGALPGLNSRFAKVYYYRSTLPFDQILGLGPLERLREWQNNARNPLGLALYMAHLLGSETLYCAGTSFVRHKTQSHERGTGYQEYVLGRTERTFNLEMYRPSSYRGKKQDPKQHWAWQGALELALRLGLKLKKIRDLDSKEILEISQLKKRGLPQAKFWEKKLSLMTVRTKEIRSFLLKQKDPEILSQLEDWGLDAKLWHKYMRML